MKARPAVLSVAALVCLSAVAGGAILNPTADSYVRDGSSASTNFGTVTPLEVRTSSNGQNRDAYFKFDVTGITGITLVKLRVNANLSGSGNVATSAYTVPTMTWTETGITWNNKPPLGSSLASVTVSGTAYVWYEFDVTTYVQSEQAAGRNVVSFALHATATSNRVISAKSRESALQKPELVVTGNQPPSAIITSPASGATFPQPANITINATASDSDGTITKVEFFQGTTKIGEDTTAPYTFAWNDVLAAAYSLTARATDNGGAVATSAAVGITVTEGGPTNVSGAIGASTTWTLSASPYIVTGDVTVGGASSPILTIEPGVKIKFNAGRTLIVGYGGSPGGLQAAGTSSRPITFTANSDSPTAGFWKGIQFNSGTTPVSRIAYATVSYGGEAGGYRGGIAVDNCSPTIENTTVQTNSYAGITLRAGGAPIVRNSTIIGNSGIGVIVGVGSSPTLESLTVTNNTGFALFTHAKVTVASISGLTLAGNGTNAVELWHGDYEYVDLDTTWKNPGVPYVVTHDIDVRKTSGSVASILTIEPGTTLKFNSGRTLLVGYFNPGNLQAVGTAAQPITFTANSGSPTAGFWRGIQFNSGTTSTSRIAHATVSYGGEAGGYRGGIAVDNCSPTIENTIVQTNSYAGITLRAGGSPTVRNSTITGNSGIGVIVGVGSSPTLETLTVTNNTGFALFTHAKVTFASISGLTLTGNGTNAVELWHGDYEYVDVDTTWKNPGVPYVVTHDIDLRKTSGGVASILTIEPGTTLKFNSGRTLLVGYFNPGNLQAVGTAAQPITFTANSGSPTAGFWKGIQFNSGTSSTSRIAYATVSYAGVAGSTGGIHMAGTSPNLDHVRFISNSYAGLSLNGASPIVQNSDFTSNSAGIVNQSPATVVNARFNWWDSVTGPSGSGGGSGQSISSGVGFQPWLTATGSAPQFFSAFFLGNSVFNPTLGIHATFNFSSTLTGSWRVTIHNAENALLRTLTGSGASGAPIWDGRNEAGVAQPDGNYRYDLDSTTGASESAAPLRGYAALDSTRQLAINSPAIAPLFFSPNADAIQETTVVSGSSTFDGATWTVNVKNSGGATIRSATGPANPAISYTWDGRDVGGALQPDGSYTLELLLADGNASASANLSATLDVTYPSAGVTYPTGSGILSNVYQSGQANVAVTGTSSDTNLNNWTLDYGTGPSPPQGMWTIVTTGTLPVVGGTLATWATEALINGLYTLRLRVWDKAGNLSTQTRNPTVGNFTVSQSALSFNSGTGGTVTYTSFVPFPLTQTLVVKNPGGQIVRTLFDGQRAAGTFANAWNGRDDQGILLPEGPYFYTATVSDGTHSMTWDLTNQYLNSSFYYYSSAAWIANFEPFNNNLLPLRSLPPGSGPGRTWILFTPTYSSEINGETATEAMCGNPGNFCQPAGAYQAPGQVNPPWAGIDTSGNFRKDIVAIVTIVNRTTFSRNAVVSHGTKPTVTGLLVAPTYYAPMVGQQTVTFSLTTYQSQPVTVRLTATNLDSHSVLRTKTVTGVAAGAGSISWDGRADNGTWVAPGRYILDLLVTDAIGNTAKAQTLTVVDY